MSHYPSSTAATDGSANGFSSLPPAPTFPHSTTTQSDAFTSMLAALDEVPIPNSKANSPSSANSPNTLGAQHITSWLDDPDTSQPHYTYTSESSTAAHLWDIMRLLTAVDETLFKK